MKEQRRDKLIISADARQALRQAFVEMESEQPVATAGGALSEFASDVAKFVDLGWSDAAIAARLTSALQQAGFDGIVVAKHHVARVRKAAGTTSPAKPATKTDSKRTKQTKQNVADATSTATESATKQRTIKPGQASRFGQSSGQALR